MWKYCLGRVGVTDPLSRHPANAIMAGAVTAELAQLTLCSVTDAETRGENDEAAADAALLRSAGPQSSDIVRGCEADPWVATAHNTAILDIIPACTTWGDALVVPDIPELKHTILHEPHDANYACWLPQKNQRYAAHVLVAWHAHGRT